jgi:predicted nucleic acid-binding protein
MLECRVGPLKRNDDLLLADYDAFFALPEIVTVPLGGVVFRLAADIRATDGLKTPDALHVVAAIEARCEAIWTADDEFDRASGRIRVKRV